MRSNVKLRPNTLEGRTSRSTWILIILFVGAAAMATINFILFTQSSIYQELQHLKKQNEELKNSIAENYANYEIIDKAQAKTRLEKQQCREKNRLNEEKASPVSDYTKNKEVLFSKALEDYFQLSRDIYAGKSAPRFVQCVILNGWGNVFQEAISCILFGLVSKRAAIMDTSPIEQYMPFKKFLRSDLFPYPGYDLSPLKKYKEFLIKRFELPCINYNDYNDKELITIHLTYDWYAPMMMVNPHHSDALLDILPANFFQIMFKRLFVLHDDIQKEVDNYKRQNFHPYMIGIQIRYPTYDNKGEKDHKGFPVPPLELYAQSAEQLARFQKEVPYNDVGFFVATQNTDLILRLKEAYGINKVKSYNGTITTTFEPHEEGQKVSLITWWLLGECDEVVTTEASSYGLTAAARRGLFPIVCNYQKFCLRRLSQTPCQDTPFVHEQPPDCLLHNRTRLHQFMTSPENSCGYFKWQIYTSPEFQNDKWNIKGLS